MPLTSTRIPLTDEHAEAMLALADRLFTAVEAADMDTVREIYAPDAVVWHNTDGIEESVEQNLRVLAWITKVVTDLRYDVVRQMATSEGFVSQHVARGTLPNGRELNLPACIICTVIEGRISRLDEYIDSRHISALRR
jgi:ketosteroid isomerase-like protein